MRRLVLLCALVTGLTFSSALAQKGEDQKDVRSDLPGQQTNVSVESKYPQPFNIYDNPKDAPAVSTGYYFNDNAVDPDPSGLDLEDTEFYRPEIEQFELPESFEPDRWTPIVAGPRILDSTSWNNNPKGMYFFRNPALPTQNNGYFFESIPGIGTDSTDDAFAGPMPIDLSRPFEFNGIAYDSFYISTNGVIALTNTRYLYDEDGRRIATLKIDGNRNAYNTQSMDWFSSFRGPRFENDAAASLSDPTPDNFGYRYSVMGNQLGVGGSNVLGGIRDFPLAGQTINNVFANQLNFKTALIAPFWGDLQVSQWDPENEVNDPFGRAYFKTDTTEQYLTIYLENFLLRTKPGQSLWDPTPPLQFTVGLNQRVNNSIPTPSGSAQVILDTRDTSITIVYDRFAGGFIDGNRFWSASDLFRWNTMAGVSGFARHVNYNRPGGPQTDADPQPWVEEYPQYTYYWNFERNPFLGQAYPRGEGRSVIFRQLQNTLRVEAIEYRVQSLDPQGPPDYTEVIDAEDVDNYELYANSDRLRGIQPVAIIQNLSNDIQGRFRGVNYVRQDLDFQARFRVRNKATGKTRYNSLVPINARCLSWDDRNGFCDGRPNEDIDFVDLRTEDGDLVIEELDYNTPPSTHYHNEPYSGLPPYDYVRVFFPPWRTNPTLDEDIGRMAASITAEPVRNDGTDLKDQWPFDDVQSVNLFVLRNLTEFYYDGSEYHFVDNQRMPSVLQWVNLGADMVAGTVASDYPLPPRETVQAANNGIVNGEIIDDRLTSPTISMDRFDAGLDWTGPRKEGRPYGDIISSFPIDIRDKRGAVVSVSIQRTQKRDSWDRGYSDQQLVGPEPRAILNSDPLTPWTFRNAASAVPDSIVVEFARPSRDEVENIVNIRESEWRYLPRKGVPAGEDNAVERSTPALVVFGGGGYISPFWEQDRDSILPPVSDEDLGGLKPNIYDTGIDFGFNKYFVPIPDTFVDWPNRGGMTFRFRIRVIATNDQKNITWITDDNDQFYVDNISLLEEDEEATDLEVSKALIKWRFSEVPATQAVEIPIEMEISNNTSTNAPFYFAQAIIWPGTIADLPQGNQAIRDLTDGIDPVYCRAVSIPQHLGNSQINVDMPAFNARNAGYDRYTLMGIVSIPGGDRESRNDTTFTEFEINLGDTYGYDPENATNDVEEFGTGLGLGSRGYVTGGIGRAAFGYRRNFSPVPISTGDPDGSASGSFAMQFEVFNADTLRGYEAYFAEANQSPDDIEFRLYRDNNGTPGQQITAGRLQTVRGFDFERTPATNNYFFGEYVSYRTDQEVILPKGEYWIGIVQLGQTSIALGANGTRTAQRTMNVSLPVPIDGPLGVAGVQSNIHPEFRRDGNDLQQINRNFFAYEEIAGSGNWAPFSPVVGNNAFAHMDHTGSIASLNSPDGTATLTRGFWIPLLRPYFGLKAQGQPGDVIENCKEWIPVELTTFGARATSRGIDLGWETASEIDNHGFYIERRDVTQGVEDEWSQIGFVKGNGTTTSTSIYDYTDMDVVSGHTYSYKLRQVDRDGSQTCYESMVQTETFMGEGAFTLENASPNPFGQGSTMTTIGYTVPENGNVKLEIVDLFGNTVAVLVNDHMNAGGYSADWDATDMTGRQVSTGTYIFRLTQNGQTQTGKVQFRN